MAYSRTYERINWEDYSSTNTPLNATNLNKMDYTLEKLDIAMAEGGGGGGGTSDYLQLSNKPKINGIELVDNITTEDLGIVVPVYTSELVNDSGFIAEESDPTVPAWAKEPTKPTYTAAEVGALPSDTPIPDPTSVVVDRLVSAGTHIADITVDGKKTELYAPTSGGGGGVSSYGELPDKPSINGITIVGNKTSEELGINSVTDTKTVNSNWQGKGVNLIKFPYYSKDGRVNRGITYNINSDGTITANGQGTEANLDSFFECANIDNNYLMLPAGTYKLSNRDDDTDTTHWVVAYKDGTTELARSSRNNGIFTLTETTKVYVLTRIYRTSSVSNLVFKPMLVEVAEDGSYPTDYQRNAMGNVEITNEISDIKNNLNNLSDIVGNANALLEGV